MFINLTPGVNVIEKFPSLLTTRPNKLECLYLAVTFQSSLMFAGNTRSLPKKEASERCSNWVGSRLALNSRKEFLRTNTLAYWASSSLMKEKFFINLTPEEPILVEATTDR